MQHGTSFSLLYPQCIHTTVWLWGRGPADIFKVVALTLTRFVRSFLWLGVKHPSAPNLKAKLTSLRAYHPPPLSKLRPCLSYSRRRDRINLVPNFNSVPNLVQPHKTWV